MRSMDCPPKLREIALTPEEQAERHHRAMNTIARIKGSRQMTAQNVLTADDFKTVYDDDHTFPFFEDEDGETYTGYGHIDKAEFARLVNEYEQLVGFDTPSCTVEDVKHGHATITFASALAAAQGFPEWHYTPVDEPNDKTIPLTWISR